MGCPLCAIRTRGRTLSPSTSNRCRVGKDSQHVSSVTVECFDIKQFTHYLIEQRASGSMCKCVAIVCLSLHVVVIVLVRLSDSNPCAVMGFQMEMVVYLLWWQALAVLTYMRSLARALPSLASSCLKVHANCTVT
mmetsp:Transcript_5051/g.15378  ORF Transcript_5051/g.15378 Transcript_5051/m.15378 type:complete len:135 (+) Transcript_5051:375-779(+)